MQSYFVYFMASIQASLSFTILLEGVLEEKRLALFSIQQTALSILILHKLHHFKDIY